MKVKVLVFSIIISALLYLGISVYVASQLTKPIKSRIEASPNVVSNNNRVIEFKASDGLTLRGWFFPNTSKNAVIFVTGLRANRIDYGYFTVDIAREFISKGYSVLMYDARARGISDGDRVGFGFTEGQDILGAVKFLEKEGFRQESIAIIGNSNGAISLLNTSDKLDDIGAIVADSAAAEYAPIIGNILSKENNIPTFFDPAVFYFAKTIYGIDIPGVKPIDKVKSKKILFLHGALDMAIPVENSRRLLEAAGDGSKLVIFPEGHHIETYKSDPELYRKEVFKFIDEELK